ncbi:MAG: hypothetical protein NVSMB13_09020 [Mycobacteriales bacterium]
MFVAGQLLSVLGAIVWLAVSAPAERVIDLPTVGAILTLAGLLVMAIAVRLALPGRARRRQRDQLGDPLGPSYHDWAGLRMPERGTTRPAGPSAPDTDQTQILPVVRDER